jgi:hypothetical protein
VVIGYSDFRKQLEQASKSEEWRVIGRVWDMSTSTDNLNVQDLNLY